MKLTENKQERKVMLLGEGIHQHTLYGNFEAEEVEDFPNVTVNTDSVLVHESPTRQPAEHEALPMEAGKWIMGRQVEYNPFEARITRVWD